MMTRMERPTAHRALVPPSRRDRRRSRSPRKVSVLAAPVAAWVAVALEVDVALSFSRLAAAGAGLAGDRGQPGPGDEVAGGREAGHVQACLGDDRHGELEADAGDLREPVGGGQDRGARAGVRAGTPSALTPQAAGMASEGGLDLVLDCGDQPVQAGDVVQVEADQHGVVGAEGHALQGPA